MQREPAPVTTEALDRLLARSCARKNRRAYKRMCESERASCETHSRAPFFSAKAKRAPALKRAGAVVAARLSRACAAACTVLRAR